MSIFDYLNEAGFTEDTAYSDGHRRFVYRDPGVTVILFTKEYGYEVMYEKRWKSRGMGRRWAIAGRLDTEGKPLDANRRAQQIIECVQALIPQQKLNPAPAV